MTLTIDDIIKLILTLSVAFSLVGISIQLMRILGGLVDTVKESNFIVHTASDLFEKITGDYDYIIEQIKSILESITGFTRGVFIPLTNIFSFLKGFGGSGRFKSKKSKKEEEEEIE
jgi:hypothetical protein